jgi:hypothetical protein
VQHHRSVSRSTSPCPESEERDQQALKIKFKIGAVFGELNKYETAEKTVKGTLSRQKELLGDDHIETQLTQHYYGRVLSRQAKWPEAYEVYEPLWKLRKEFLNDDSPADLAIRIGHELGRILNELERFGEAAEVLGIIHPTAKNNPRSCGQGYSVFRSRAWESPQVF